MFGEGSSRIYNIISLVFLILTVLVLVFVITTLASPPPDDDGTDVGAVATLVVLPSFTPTPTPTITSTPTITPIPTFTPTFTTTPSATNTLAPTPTITDTPGPTLTPSDTPTPSAEPTITATPTPTGPTPTRTATLNPFLFDVVGEVFIGPNQGNTAGCAWQGVGGSVLDLNGAEIASQYQVRVLGNGLDRSVLTGTNSAYGTVSGWEIALNNTIAPQTVFVRLETIAGTQVSREVQVDFVGACEANAAIIRFQQTRPFGPPTAPTVPGP